MKNAARALHPLLLMLFALLAVVRCPVVLAQDDSLPSRSQWHATMSSSELPAMAPALAIDADATTKWGGPFSPGHWLQIDLGRTSSIGGALIQWDLAFAHSYVIQASQDGQQWQTVFETTDSPGGSDYVFFPPVQTRYLRLASVPRTADWGVSIFEFEPLGVSDSPQISGFASSTDIASLSLTGTSHPLTVRDTQKLLIDLPRPLALAGVEVFWSGARRSARLEGREASGEWIALGEDPDSVGVSSFLAARDSHTLSELRLTVLADRSGPAAIERLRLLGPSRVMTPMKRYEILAARANRVLFPATLHQQQVYWTVVGIPGGRQKSVFDEYGNLEAFKSAPLVQALWRDASGTAAVARNTITHTLRRGWMPMPTVQWSPHQGLHIRSEAITIEQAGAPVTLVRHRVINNGNTRAEGRLSLIVRPMQVSPPWQNGGFSPIRTISIEGTATNSSIRVNGRRLFESLTAVDARGAAQFGRHGEDEVTQHAAAGSTPVALIAQDDEGLATALLSYQVSLDPGAHRDIVIAFSLGTASWAPGAGTLPEAPPLNREQLLGPTGDAGAGFDKLSLALEAQWQSRLGHIGLTLPDPTLVDMLRAQAAYMLINQTGRAMQPGPRNYSRSFIRDGSATAAVLVRMGMATTARDYLRWYAGHAVRDNGLISPILNDDGSVNTGFGSDIEYDSQGQFIWLIAEIARLDGGADSVREYQPQVRKALQFLQQLREHTLVAGYLADRPAPERFRGIIAPSISHEGYATPTHSYWDDYWALKGWHDGLWLASQWGDRELAAWAREQYDALRESVAASIRATMQWKGSDFIPTDADSGNGDPTSVSIALDPTDQQDLLPSEALRRTFSRYLDDVRKRDTPDALYAYTPYELRNVLTFVQLDQPQQANELLTALIRHRRPAAWQVLAEVVYSDLRHAIYLGDMPHTWIGSEYARAIFGMLMHEGDDSLNLLPGAPPSWVEGPGLSVTQLPTAHGRLTMTARQQGDTLQVTLGDGIDGKTAMQVAWPTRTKPVLVTIDGKRQRDYTASGIHIKRPFKTLIAQW